MKLYKSESPVLTRVIKRTTYTASKVKVIGAMSGDSTWYQTMVDGKKEREREREVQIEQQVLHNRFIRRGHSKFHCGEPFPLSGVCLLRYDLKFTAQPPTYDLSHET